MLPSKLSFRPRTFAPDCQHPLLSPPPSPLGKLRVSFAARYGALYTRVYTCAPRALENVLYVQFVQARKVFVATCDAHAARDAQKRVAGFYAGCLAMIDRLILLK